MNKLTTISLILGLVFSQNNTIAKTNSTLVNTPNSTVETTTETTTKNSLDLATKAESFSFSFDNAFDYSSCMDVILLAYEKRISELEQVKQNECANDVLSTFGTNISQELALQLIEAANLHATEGLEDALYPVLGIRRIVAINLGYIYKIDINNEDVLRLIES